MKNPIFIGVFLCVAIALYLKNHQNNDDMPDQETSTIDDVIVTLDPTSYFSAGTDEATMQKNIRAFLDMIAFSEGTGSRYDVIFGYPNISGRTFDNYADHPRMACPFDLNGKRLWTTAAGRYQFMAISQKPDGTYTKTNTWDSLRSKLDLPDFGPDSQDLAAIELIRQRGALNDVAGGRVQVAIAKCAPIWASLPGAGYAQPERQLGSLIAAFNNSGGTVAQG